jgi:hypothetical protein
MEQKMQQGKGWEWWPTIAWQFFWAWIVAPIVLWRSRYVSDTHGWRVQTIGCCVSGLHATPMWLIALYIPGMEPVNTYWIPPQWIAVSIMLIEIFTVWLPCWQVVRHQTLQQETPDAIALWQARTQKGSSLPGSTLPGSAGSSPSIVGKLEKGLALDADQVETGSFETARSESIFTMEVSRDGRDDLTIY